MADDALFEAAEVRDLPSSPLPIPVRIFAHLAACMSWRKHFLCVPMLCVPKIIYRNVRAGRRLERHREGD